MTAILNRIGLVLSGALALFVVLAITGTVSGGPLDPPAPVAPTGPGQISALPATISEPGSYIVTRPLTSAGTGITITTSDVTIDLQGFTLTGPGTAGTAVAITGPQENITIKHGTFRGWTAGIDAPGTVYARISDIALLGNGSGAPGTGLTIGPHSTIEDCIVAGFTLDGIAASYVTIRDCNITDNDGNAISSAEGSYVYDNLIRNNGVGFYSLGAGLKPGSAFNYVRNNHLCFNFTDIITSLSEGENGFVGNTLSSYAFNAGDIAAVTHPADISGNTMPADLNNLFLANGPDSNCQR